MKESLVVVGDSKEHHALIGIMVTTDVVESLFASLTSQLQIFCSVALRIHALATCHAGMNEEFHCNLQDAGLDGIFHWKTSKILF